jgi:ribosomal-protein-alanine N-acetyltransferase
MAPADLDRVAAIAQSLKAAPHWPRAAYLDALNPAALPRRIALVAERAGDENALLGFAVASILAPQSELEIVAVAANAQRQGVGGRLLDALIENLCVAEATELMLEVRASNEPALGLYRARGFRLTGRRPRYYADPVEDALLLFLPLR